MSSGFLPFTSPSSPYTPPPASQPPNLPLTQPLPRTLPARHIPPPRQQDPAGAYPRAPYGYRPPTSSSGYSTSWSYAHPSLHAISANAYERESDRDSTDADDDSDIESNRSAVSGDSDFEQDHRERKNKYRRVGREYRLRMGADGWGWRLGVRALGVLGVWNVCTSRLTLETKLICVCIFTLLSSALQFLHVTFEKNTAPGSPWVNIASLEESIKRYDWEWEWRNCPFVWMCVLGSGGYIGVMGLHGGA